MRLLNDYLLKVERFDPQLTNYCSRTLRVDAPETYFFHTDDGVELRLLRYRGGEKGPVILSHCIGVSSHMFSLPTIETNLLEYMYENGYDVWLLDHRLSIELPASGLHWTMDDVATKDYPAAVDKVCELSAKDSVQIIAHGVGASTLTMSLLAGLQKVSAVVCSQVSTHLNALPVNEFKAKLPLPGLLKSIGKKTMTAYTDVHSGLFGRLYDVSLMMHPIAKGEECNNAVCHRVTTLFGELYEHSQINAETHAYFGRLFGRVNLTAMSQLTSILLKGKLIDAEGDDVYLPNAKRLTLPMTFISGGNNACVLPSSTQKTIEFLSDVNGPEYYKRFEIGNYGHVDCIIGKNAVNDVYPFILDRLEMKSRVSEAAKFAI